MISLAIETLKMETTSSEEESGESEPHMLQSILPGVVTRTRKTVVGSTFLIWNRDMVREMI